MPKDELLPGVTTPACPPAVVCDARKTIRMARRRALARDAAQLTVLAAVDYLFLRWPESRVPLLSREQSLTVITATNAAIAAHLWAVRYLLPRFSAWRAASTWCRSERARFTRYGLGGKTQSDHLPPAPVGSRESSSRVTPLTTPGEGPLSAVSIR